MLQTMVFVAYNSVCTAQYFMWFLCLVPVALQHIRPGPITMWAPPVLLWAGSLALWLGLAYLLEFTGRALFVELWVAALIFHVSTVLVIAFFIYTARP